MHDVTLTIEGTTPLLMHNEQLSDPLLPLSKELKAITSKRTKTDEDHEAMAWLEFQGGLYYDNDAGVYIPGKNIFACIRDGGKIQKKGTDIKRGVAVKDKYNTLVYPGPRTPRDLYEQGFYDRQSVSAQGSKGGSRTIRTRPQFAPGWRCTFVLYYDPQVINGSDLRACTEIAGRLIGLCDYRPIYGKFDIIDWVTGQ